MEEADHYPLLHLLVFWVCILRCRALTLFSFHGACSVAVLFGAAQAAGLGAFPAHVSFLLTVVTHNYTGATPATTVSGAASTTVTTAPSRGTTAWPAAIKGEVSAFATVVACAHIWCAAALDDVETGGELSKAFLVSKKRT
jgi:hypothetical protein